METVITEALTSEAFASIDWENERQSGSHPVKVRLVDNQILDYWTGGVIAVVSPKYRLYWSHSHLHLAPADWDGEGT